MSLACCELCVRGTTCKLSSSVQDLSFLNVLRLCSNTFFHYVGQWQLENITMVTKEALFYEAHCSENIPGTLVLWDMCERGKQRVLEQKEAG